MFAFAFILRLKQFMTVGLRNDGIMANSINLFCVLHLSVTCARPKRCISFDIIAS